MRRIEIEVPYLPPTQVRGNSSTRNPHHKGRIAKAWRKSGEENGTYEYDGDWATLRDISPPIKKAEVQYTFYSTQASHCDDSNFIIGMKPWIDGLRDAGVLEEDTTNHLTELKPIFIQCKKGNEKTIICIEEVLE